MRSLGMRSALLGAITICGVGLLEAAPAQADTFDLTSCHLSGGCGTATQFGTVTLTESGSDVHFDVVLNSGNLFVSTGAGGKSLFLFNDTLSGSTITNITATFNGATVTIPGGLSGLTNQSPIMANGTGTFTAQVFCTNDNSCNGASGADANDLHFDVTSATIAQLLVGNANGNMFVADILLGQTGGTGLTGPVDVSVSQVPLPPAAMLFGSALVGLGLLGRRRRKVGADVLAQA